MAELEPAEFVLLGELGPAGVAFLVEPVLFVEVLFLVGLELFVEPLDFFAPPDELDFLAPPDELDFFEPPDFEALDFAPLDFAAGLDAAEACGAARSLTPDPNNVNNTATAPPASV